ncbi:MAG: lipoyl protein ligase domain-containing protein [Bacillota bacterium]
MPSVMVGRFQNTLNQVDIEYVTENKLHVVRRIAGGGAVYHDLGNSCFATLE